MTYEEMPQMYVVEKTKHAVHTTVNFDIEETEDGYTCNSVTIVTDEPINADSYGLIVASIIRMRYSADDVEAIVNNYLLTKTAEHKSEMSAMQDWRKKAKEVAKSIIESLNVENNE